MTRDAKKEEQILDARDNINAAIRHLRIDRILFSVFECLLQDSLPFLLNENDKYAFFLQASESFTNHLKELRNAWNELEQLQAEC